MITPQLLHGMDGSSHATSSKPTVIAPQTAHFTIK
jgi:hypothetical protein